MWADPDLLMIVEYEVTVIQMRIFYTSRPLWVSIGQERLWLCGAQRLSARGGANLLALICGLGGQRSSELAVVFGAVAIRSIVEDGLAETG